MYRIVLREQALLISVKKIWKSSSLVSDTEGTVLLSLIFSRSGMTWFAALLAVAQRKTNLWNASDILPVRVGWEVCLLWIGDDLPIRLDWNRKRGVENRLDVWKPALWICKAENRHVSSSQALTSGQECWQRKKKKKRSIRKSLSLINYKLPDNRTAMKSISGKGHEKLKQSWRIAGTSTLQSQLAPG